MKTLVPVLAYFLRGRGRFRCFKRLGRRKHPIQHPRSQSLVAFDRKDSRFSATGAKHLGGLRIAESRLRRQTGCFSA
jgi:hypothetical protein